MNRKACFAVVLASALLTPFTPVGIGVAAAQDEERIDHAMISQGRSLYRAWCRTCHGDEAKGDGPTAEYLSPKPADLTLLSRKNKGIFPFEEVVKKIDGREKVKGHGSSDMPVWGMELKKTEGDMTEEQLQDNFAALTHYIRSLQVP